MLQISNTINVAEIFFNEPTKHHYLIEISKKSKLAHTSTKKYLILLKKEGVIKEVIEKKGKRSYPIFTAELNSNQYKNYKKIYNLIKINDSGIIDFLKDKLMPKSIILFGSYSRGEDIEDSDIDIFIESKKQDIDLNKFEKELKRKIELHFNESLNNYPKELKNNIINGEILYGYLEIYK
jgi:predicted nucleotidyltransferase